MTLTIPELVKQECIGVLNFLHEAVGFQNTFYIDKNPFGIKPGYYENEQIAELYIQYQQSLK